MRLSEKIISALRNSFETALFFATMAAKEDFRNHVVNAGANAMNPSLRLAILGNGPSLAMELPQLIASEYCKQADVMAVNFFALSEEFSIIKPKYDVISDPMFFRKAGHSERIEKFTRLCATR